jgi:hypothetical protein
MLTVFFQSKLLHEGSRDTMRSVRLAQLAHIRFAAARPANAAASSLSDVSPLATTAPIVRFCSS